MSRVFVFFILFWIPLNAVAEATIDCNQLDGGLKIHKTEIGRRFFIAKDKPFTGKCINKGYEAEKTYEWNFRDGLKHGTSTSWYENGQKEWEDNYKDGEQHGTRTRWYENGKKSVEWNYKEGELRSVKEWDEEGNLTKDETY
jgi:antitoxin component YwqK of YwqJK toxin-antitoxin module